MTKCREKLQSMPRVFTRSHLSFVPDTRNPSLAMQVRSGLCVELLSPLGPRMVA